jgi:CRISPR/Cas system-associated protein Csx1
MKRILSISALLCSFFVSSLAFAAPNLQNGKAIDQAKCYACHAKKTGFANGDMIYTRSDRKVKDYARLKTMVAMCNTELRLDMFPEDEADVTAYLNKQFYKFKP